MRNQICDFISLGDIRPALKLCNGSYELYVESLEECMASSDSFHLIYQLGGVFMLGKRAFEFISDKKHVRDSLKLLNPDTIIHMGSYFDYKRHRGAVFEGIYSLHSNNAIANTKFSSNNRKFLAFSEEKDVFRVSVFTEDESMCYIKSIFDEKTIPMNLNLVLNSTVW